MSYTVESLRLDLYFYDYWTHDALVIDAEAAANIEKAFKRREEEGPLVFDLPDGIEVRDATDEEVKELLKKLHDEAESDDFFQEELASKTIASPSMRAENRRLSSVDNVRRQILEKRRFVPEARSITQAETDALEDVF